MSGTLGKVRVRVRFTVLNMMDDVVSHVQIDASSNARYDGLDLN